MTGADPGAEIEIQGYSQNHYGTANFANDTNPVDRPRPGETLIADQNGSVTVNDIRPASNTRLRARQRGCAFGPDDLGTVINVRTQLTLAVARSGPLTYVISGKSIPARPGGLIVSLYLIVGQQCAAGVEPSDCPGEVLIAQDRADQVNGRFRFLRSFNADRRGQRILLVLKTGQDAQNAPGRSNVRSLLII